jgi:hypothetical protein
VQVALIAGLVALFCARALDIGRVYNHTFDEPTQIASGVELWQYGTFLLQADVPPLAKLLIAAPTYVAGVRLAEPPTERGDLAAANRLLYDSGRYWFVLRSARAVSTATGALLIVALAWFAWAGFGGWAAVAATWVAACSPGLISAASIANSDILGVLTVVAAFYVFRRLLEQGGGRRTAALFALVLAAALATKLSALPFLAFGLPVVAAFTLGSGTFEPVRHPLAFLRAQGAALLVVALIVPVAIWSTYGFHLAPPIGHPGAVFLAESLRPRAPQIADLVERLPGSLLPLGGFIRGVGVASDIARLGHPAYLMGHFALHGWPYYFVITLLLKVPVGTLAAVLLTFLLALRRRRTPEGREVLLLLGLCAAILASVARAGVNAGHRHIVCIEALFAVAVAGGFALALTEEARWRRLTLATLVGALVLGGAASLRAHPDALGYTNLLAGPDPSWWFIDSNLDWGQDLERLRTELAARVVTEEIRLAYFGTAEPARHGINARPLVPGVRTTGWIAVSVTNLRGLIGASGWGTLPDEAERTAYAWLLAETPVARIGTSIRLYHLPPSASAHFQDGVLDGAPDTRHELVERMELLDTLAPLPAHPFTLVRMRPEVLDRLPQRARVAGRNEDPVHAVLEDIALSGHAAADHGLSHGHGFRHDGHAVVGIRGIQWNDHEARARVQGAQLEVRLRTDRHVRRKRSRLTEIRHPSVCFPHVHFRRDVAGHGRVADRLDQGGVIAHLAADRADHVGGAIHRSPELLVHQPAQLDNARRGNPDLVDREIVLDRRPEDHPMDVGVDETEHGRFPGGRDPREERDVRHPRPGRLQQGGQRDTETLAPRDHRVVLVPS